MGTPPFISHKTYLGLGLAVTSAASALRLSDAPIEARSISVLLHLGEFFRVALEWL